MTDSQPTQLDPRPPADAIRPNGLFIQHVARRTRGAAAAIGRSGSRTRDFSAKLIQAHPMTTAAVSLCIGAAVGALISGLGRRGLSTRRRTA